MDNNARELVTYVCRDCGSDQVLSDAYAEWVPHEWRWEVTSVFPKGDICIECDGPTTMEEIPLAEFEATQKTPKEEDE